MTKHEQYDQYLNYGGSMSFKEWEQDGRYDPGADYAISKMDRDGKFNLNRPLCFIDLETTGVDTKNDRIVEISILKIDEESEVETKTKRVNPTIPIPKEASDVHGIKDEDVRKEPTFRQLAKGILAFIEGCDIAGFNSNKYDLPLLYSEFVRAGVDWDYSKSNLIDVGNIFKILQPRTLEAAVKLYLGKDHDGAHGAEADVRATAQVFFRIIHTNDGLPKDITDLALYSNFDKPILDLSGAFSTDKDGNIIFNMGKHRGQQAGLHLDYLDWMLKSDFAPDTKAICQKLLQVAKERDANYLTKPNK